MLFRLTAKGKNLQAAAYKLPLFLMLSPFFLKQYNLKISLALINDIFTITIYKIRRQNDLREVINLKYKILIAEDDVDISELLRLYLEGSNFEVTTASDGAQALSAIQNEKFNLLVLDIMMPKINGYELTKAVRQFSNVPIIILSAKSSDNDRILGLNIGADAYITKPFNPMEVIAQINASLRRFYHLGSDAAESKKERFIKIGELCVDLENFILTKNDAVVPLTSTELKILIKLMSSPGRVYTKAQLYACINGEFFETDDNTMMVHISNLREKIEDDPKNPKYIKTIRGLGYKIDAV